MNIYMRTALDSNGDASEYYWYCSYRCYMDDSEAATAPNVEDDGGEWPGGSESDTPDVCAQCGDPIGNPLTDYGIAELARTLYDERTEYADAMRAEYADALDRYGILPDDDDEPKGQ